MRLYEESISLSHQNGFLNVEALGYELYAKHLVTMGYNVLASNAVSKAIEVYSIWGANVKVDLLRSKYSNLLDSLQHRSGSLLADHVLANPTRPSDLDTMIIVRAVQMLSQGIESHGLLERFVTLVVQSAGAEKGAVVLRSDRKSTQGSILTALGSPSHAAKDLGRAEEMKVAVLWDVRKSEQPNVFLSRVPLAECTELPGNIIQAVCNTQQHVLIQNIKESDFNTSNAALTSGSVLCLPIFLNANTVVGVMYLDHSASNVFSHERLHMLELLCVQLGILLENSALYESVQESKQM